MNKIDQHMKFFVDGVGPILTYISHAIRNGELKLGAKASV